MRGCLRAGLRHSIGLEDWSRSTEGRGWDMAPNPTGWMPPEIVILDGLGEQSAHLKNVALSRIH